MTWKVRHEGSPDAVEMTLEQLEEQLADGAWEATDEVRGPGDADWVAIDAHPRLEEAAADLEPPPARPYDDETRLDMTALIDVTLVLLVFFILTTTVSALQKRLEAPTANAEDKAKVAKVTKEHVEKQMIHLVVKTTGGETVYTMEGQPVEAGELEAAMKKYVRATRKTSLLLEHDDDSPQDAVVRAIDAAKGAGMDNVRLLVP